MFDAARARIAAFALHVVKPGLIFQEVGRLLGQAQQVRLIADYRGDPVDAKDAARAVEWAETFVATVRQALSSQIAKQRR